MAGIGNKAAITKTRLYVLKVVVNDLRVFGANSVFSKELCSQVALAGS
jgi:hypothetical protein